MMGSIFTALPKLIIVYPSMTCMSGYVMEETGTAQNCLYTTILYVYPYKWSSGHKTFLLHVTKNYQCWLKLIMICLFHHIDKNFNAWDMLLKLLKNSPMQILYMQGVWRKSMAISRNKMVWMVLFYVYTILQHA